MTPVTVQAIRLTTPHSIAERVRDLQGVCTLAGGEFDEGDEMHRIFHRVAEELEMIRQEINTLSPPCNCATTGRSLHMV